MNGYVPGKKKQRTIHVQAYLDAAVLTVTMPVEKNRSSILQLIFKDVSREFDEFQVSICSSAV